MLKNLFTQLAGLAAPPQQVGPAVPPDPQALVAAALARVAEGGFEAALATLDGALRVAAADPLVHAHRGRVLLLLRRYDAAEDAFALALDLQAHAWLEQQAAIARAAREAARGTAPLPPGLPLPAGAAERFVSVVACSIDSAKFERMSRNYAERLAGVPHEIVGIHDARSLCEGYNRGLARARGDVVIFSHDDVEIVSPDFAAQLLDALDRVDIVGVAGASLYYGREWLSAGFPNVHGQVAQPRAGGWRASVYDFGEPLATGIQVLDGLFMAARRDALDGLAFDAETFDGWHGYDVDFTWSAHLAGRSIGVRRDLLIRHHSSGSFDAAWRRYADRFSAKHAASLPASAPGSGVPVTHLPIASDAEWLRLAAQLVRL